CCAAPATMEAPRAHTSARSRSAPTLSSAPSSSAGARGWPVRRGRAERHPPGSALAGAPYMGVLAGASVQARFELSGRGGTHPAGELALVLLAQRILGYVQPHFESAVVRVPLLELAERLKQPAHRPVVLEHHSGEAGDPLGA